MKRRSGWGLRYAHRTLLTWPKQAEALAGVCYVPLRCWQFRLKEPKIRTPSPMLGQAMFICVPSA
ncbi:hypothetical protein ACQXYE_11295, partial [Corynebacterium diphtheriae]